MTEFEVVPESSTQSPALELAIDRLAASRADAAARLKRQQALTEQQPPTLTYLGQSQGQPVLQAPGGQPFRAGERDSNGSLLRGGIAPTAIAPGVVRTGGMPRVQSQAELQAQPNPKTFLLFEKFFDYYPDPFRCEYYLKIGTDPLRLVCSIESTIDLDTATEFSAGIVSVALLNVSSDRLIFQAVEFLSDVLEPGYTSTVYRNHVFVLSDSTVTAQFSSAADNADTPFSYPVAVYPDYLIRRTNLSDLSNAYPLVYGPGYSILLSSPNLQPYKGKTAAIYSTGEPINRWAELLNYRDYKVSNSYQSDTTPAAGSLRIYLSESDLGVMGYGYASTLSNYGGIIPVAGLKVEDVKNRTPEAQAAVSNQLVFEGNAPSGTKPILLRLALARGVMP